MRPVDKRYKMHFGFNEPYPESLKYLTADGLHKGFDYLTPIGIPIIACVDGIIAFKGFSPEFGNNIKIEFKTLSWLKFKRFRLILAHLSSFLTAKPVGDKVRKTELVGLSGDSGSASGHPHLHAQVNTLVDNLWKPINPSFVCGAT